MKRLFAENRPERIYKFDDEKHRDECEGAIDGIEVVGKKGAGKAADIIQKRQSES
jgi:hypothetical protein